MDSCVYNTNYQYKYVYSIEFLRGEIFSTLLKTRFLHVSGEVSENCGVSPTDGTFSTTNVSSTTFDMVKTTAVRNETLTSDTTYPSDDTSEMNYDTTEDLKDNNVQGISILIFL